MDKQQTMSMLNCSVDDNLNIGTTTCGDATYTVAGDSISAGITGTTSCWHYFQDYYYPQVIRESYPVYIQEKSIDKGKQAFEIIKMLKDKRFIRLETVGDFIDAMDALIKIL
jgi:hypothetical protein